MKKYLFALLGLTIFLSCVHNVFAGNRIGQTTASVGVGYYHFAYKRHLENNATPFFALTYNLTDCWAIEGLGGILNSKRHRFVDESVQGYFATIDAIYRFAKFGRFEPFLAGGVGAVGLKPNHLDPVSQGNVNLGAGLQYFFYDTIAFRADAKDIYTISGGKNDIFLGLGLSFILDNCCCKRPC